VAGSAFDWVCALNDLQDVHGSRERMGRAGRLEVEKIIVFRLQLRVWRKFCGAWAGVYVRSRHCA